MSNDKMRYGKPDMYASRVARERIERREPTLSLTSSPNHDGRETSFDSADLRLRHEIQRELSTVVLELTMGMHIEEPHHHKIPLAVRRCEEAKYLTPIEDEREGLYDWGQTHVEED